MHPTSLDHILTQIAHQHHTTVDVVRREMYEAMQIAQDSTDPAIQAKWDTIPRKGKEITLEEFIDYLIKEIQSSQS